MTKEEEAIEYIQKQIDYYKEQIKFIEAVDSDYYDEEYELYKNRIKQFETVLNMLKEKDKQIAKYEKIYKEYDCYRWVKELEKKDKQIDLMAEQIKILEPTMKIESFDIQPKTKFGMRYLNKEEVKQYFERKASE